MFAKEGLSKCGVGVARGTEFQEVRPGDGFKTGDFVKEKLGGLPHQEVRPGAGFKTGDFVKEKLGGLPQDELGHQGYGRGGISLGSYLEEARGQTPSVPFAVLSSRAVTILGYGSAIKRKVTLHQAIS